MGNVVAHSHTSFAVPDGVCEPLGRPVDHWLLGEYVSAAADDCGECRAGLFARILCDEHTACRLVELACIATQGLFGALPRTMVDEGSPSTAAPEFRALVRSMLGDPHAGVITGFRGLSHEQRRAACETASSILLPYLASSEPLA